MTKKLKPSLLCLAIFSWGIASSSASITTFANRALFEAALLDLSSEYERFDEDLNAFSVDTSFQGISLPLNGFSIAGTGASTTANKIDSAPFEASGKQQIDNTPFLRAQHQTSGAASNYSITFERATFAWGADIDDVEQGTTSLLLSDGSVLDLNNGFVGFVSTVGLTSMASNGGGTGDSVGIDNITLVAVPEPAASAAIVGFCVLGLLARRRGRWSAL